MYILPLHLGTGANTFKCYMSANICFVRDICCGEPCFNDTPNTGVFLVHTWWSSRRTHLLFKTFQTVKFEDIAIHQIAPPPADRGRAQILGHVRVKILGHVVR